jgi:signal transduction histidine kinase
MKTVSNPPGSLSAVASIVHDLRNPLAAIQGSAEVLLRSALPQPQVDRIARNVYCASVHIRELLEEFLDYTRAAVKELELSDIRELVRSAVDKIAVSAEFQSVRIDQAVPAGLVVALDRRRMLRMLLNLLLNALQAMPEGGTIRILGIADGGSVLLQVRDTGPGIPPQMQGRLFQPFATAGKPGGIGLGLALSRQAVVDHGGEMWVESSSAGACFSVRLPRMS